MLYVCNVGTLLYQDGKVMPYGANITIITPCVIIILRCKPCGVIVAKLCP